jgi:hypothetical protein
MGLCLFFSGSITLHSRECCKDWRKAAGGTCGSRHGEGGIVIDEGYPSDKLKSGRFVAPSELGEETIVASMTCQWKGAPICRGKRKVLNGR